MLDAQLKIEGQLFRSFWDDGLLDTLCGVALLALGIGWGLHQGVVAAIVPPVMIPLWKPLRRKLVEPRAGFVEFSRKRQLETRRGLKMVFVLCVGAFLLGVGTYVAIQAMGGAEALGGLRRVISGLPALLLAVGAVIVAHLTGARRFQLYALLLALLASTTIVMQLGPAMPPLASGIVVTFSGAILLVRFLRASARFEGGP